MSLYMSKSLIGNVNLQQELETDVILKIKDKTFKIKELTVLNDKIELDILTDHAYAYQLLSRVYDLNDINLGWAINKSLISYNVVFLKHFLENDMDSYILKLQLNFEV